MIFQAMQDDLDKRAAPDFGQVNGDGHAHTPRRVSPASVRRTCPETSVPIGLQANHFV